MKIVIRVLHQRVKHVLGDQEMVESRDTEDDVIKEEVMDPFTMPMDQTKEQGE